MTKISFRFSEGELEHRNRYMYLPLYLFQYFLNLAYFKQGGYAAAYVKNNFPRR